MAVTQGITGAGGVPTNDVTFDEMFGIPTDAAAQGIAPTTTLLVRNSAAALGNASVRIAELHGTGGQVVIPPGEKEYFRVNDGGIKSALVRGTGAIVDWGPVVSTRS